MESLGEDDSEQFEILRQPLLQTLAPIWEHLFDIMAAIDVMDGVSLNQVSTGVMGDYIFIACTEKKETDAFWDFYLHMKKEAESFGLAPKWLPCHFQSSTASLFLSLSRSSFCFSISCLSDRLPVSLWYVQMQSQITAENTMQMRYAGTERTTVYTQKCVLTPKCRWSNLSRE